jgi:hypothetical protein
VSSSPEIHLSTRRKLAFVALLLVTVLGCAEGGLRVRQWLRYGSPSTGVRDPMLVFDADAGIFVPRPGYSAKGGRIDIEINSLGFRSDEIARVKPPHTIRIATLGASTTFCAESSSNRTTWPMRLQAKLQAVYPSVKIEVVNAAVGGYTSEENLKSLEHRVLPLGPDLVIYYEANNEIVKDTRALATQEGIGDTDRQPSYVGAISKYSLLVDLAYKNLVIAARSRAGSAHKIDRVPPNLPDHFLSVLDAMRADLEPRHVPLVLSTFLVKYRRDQDRTTQISNADVAFFYMPWMSIDGMLDAMDVYNQAILDYAGRRGLPVVDDRTAIAPDAAHYSDCMHLLDPGSEAMAERFSRFLVSSKVLDPAVQAAVGTTSLSRMP